MSAVWADRAGRRALAHRHPCGRRRRLLAPLAAATIVLLGCELHVPRARTHGSTVGLVAAGGIGLPFAGGMVVAACCRSSSQASPLSTSLGLLGASPAHWLLFGAVPAGGQRDQLRRDSRRRRAGRNAPALDGPGTGEPALLVTAPSPRPAGPPSQ